MNNGTKREPISYQTGCWKKGLTSLVLTAIALGATSYSQAATVSDEAGLRAAITSKDSAITIPAGATITLTQPLPAINYNTTISGAFDGSSVIDGAGTYPAFDVTLGANVTIQGLTIQNTRLTGAARKGGAAISNAGNLTVSECHFQNNVVDVTGVNTTAALGGAVFSEGTLDLQNSSFFNNTALGAAGRVTAQGNLAPTVAAGGAVYLAGGGNVLNCTFSGNLAKGGDGVGKDPKIASSAGAHSHGGALGVNTTATASLVFLTFVDNEARGGDTEISSGGGATGGGVGFGGAISSSGLTTTIQNSIFSGSKEITGAVVAAPASSMKPDVEGAFTDGGGNLFSAPASVVKPMTKVPNGTQVYPIDKSSPAYNKAVAVVSVNRDQRGIVRPRAAVGTGTGFDIGAYQLGVWTVTADNKARPYNTVNPALTYTVRDPYSNIVSVSGNADISTTAVQTSPVGNYPITVAQGTLDPANDYVFVGATLTVNPVPLIVTADDKSRPYNTENPPLTYVITDAGGTPVAVSGLAALSTPAVKTSPAGGYPINVAQGTLDNNYTYTFVPGTLTVTKPALTVTADNKQRLYNTANPPLTYVITDGSGAVVSVPGTAALSTTAVQASPVGDYPITVTQGTLDNNYSYTFVNGTLKVTPAALIVTADNKSRPYNTPNPALTYVITDGSGAVVAVTGTAAISTTAVQTSPVGSYPITVAQGTLDNNYTYTFIPGTLTVTRPALTVTADDKTRAYNTPNPALTYVITDGSGTVVAVTGTAAISTTAVQTSPVGAYPITVSQGTLDNNYSYTFVNGTLTVTPAALIVTADDKTRPYNTDNPALTYVVTDGSGTVVSVPGTPALSTTAVKASPVGSYPITVAQGSLDKNYTYTFIPGTLTITKGALIVTADDKTRPYNTDNPALTYVVKDGAGKVVNVSGAAALSTTAVKTTPVGTYPIVPTQGTLDDNYAYTFVNGTLTITQPALRVIADNQTRPYNTPNPPLTYVVKDSAGNTVSVSGAASVTTTAIISSPVGDYPIVPTQGTLDSNYTYTFVNGTLKITRSALIVTADNKSRPYNTANPPLTYTITDSSGSVVSVGGLADLATTAVVTSNAGDYPITVKQGTLDPNYTYTYVNGKLTVTPIGVAIALPGSERYYGQRNADAISDLTSTNVSWTRDDLVFYYGGAWVPFSTFANDFSGDPQIKTDAADYTAKVGDYNVIVYTGSLRSRNVTITNAVSGNILTENKNNSLDPLTAPLGDYLRVLPVDLHITAYADPEVAPIGVTPTFKYYYGITNVVTGKREGFFVNNETEGDLISRPRARLKDLFVDLSVPGIYTLTPYGAQSENYNIIRHDGSFAVYNDRWSLEEGPLPRNYEKTGLFEQLVLVKNDSTNNWVGLELNVAQVDGGTVVNATRTTKDGYCLLHNYPVVPGEVVAFVVEYQIPEANALWSYPEYSFTPLFAGLNDRTEVRTASTGSGKPITSQITVVDVPTYSSEDWTFDTAPATPVGLRYLEKYGWAAWVNVGILLTVDDVTAGKTYEIQFSNDNVNWTPVVPRVKATSKTLVWTDKGAPKTPTHPLVGGASVRFYRVVEMP